MTLWRQLAVVTLTASMVAGAGCGGAHGAKNSASAPNSAVRSSSTGSVPSKPPPPPVVPASISTPPPVQTRSTDYPGAAFPGEGMYNIVSQWQTELGDHAYYLLAGDLRASHGPQALHDKPVLIVVSRVGAFPTDYTPPHAPQGPLTITGIKGDIVSVRDASGGTEAFHLETKSWAQVPSPG